MNHDPRQVFSRLRDAFLRSAVAGLAIQHRDGSFAAGNIGRHEHLHTPVRNTAHWLVTLGAAWRQTGDARFEAGAQRAADYLLRSEWRPAGKAFFCRNRPGSDRSNGLIGQAWVLDALVHAARVLQRTDCEAVARDVFLAHPFDESVALWHVLDPYGASLGLSVTFNQQLWFAVAGASILDCGPDAVVEQRVSRFIEETGRHFRVDRYGLALHTFRPYPTPLRRLADTCRAMRGRHPQQVGYHSFVLSGFARLLESRRLGGSRLLWTTLRKALRVLIERRFRTMLEGDPFAWSYNPTGLEVAFVLRVFRSEIGEGGIDVDEEICWWIETQLNRHFDESTGLMNHATRDPHVLPARMCEAVDVLALHENT